MSTFRDSFAALAFSVPVLIIIGVAVFAVIGDGAESPSSLELAVPDGQPETDSSPRAIVKEGRGHVPTIRLPVEDGELEELRATVSAQAARIEELEAASPPGDDLDRVAAEHNHANDLARRGFNRNGSEATTDERRLLWELAPDQPIERLEITPRAFELMAKMIDHRHGVAQLAQMASDDFSPETRAALEAARARVLRDLLSWRGSLFLEFNWQ